MRKYARFISGLHKYFRGRLEPQEALEQARKLLKKRIASRERNFLSLVEKGIFGYAKSPYLRLLAAKRIDFADIRNGSKARASKPRSSGCCTKGCILPSMNSRGRRKSSVKASVSSVRRACSTIPSFRTCMRCAAELPGVPAPEPASTSSTLNTVHSTMR